MTPAARGPRITAALAAALVVASIGLVGWHRGHELHGRCAKDGEALHLAKLAGGGRAPVDAGVASATAAGWLVEDGDRHCEILGTSDNPATVSAPLHFHAVLAATPSAAVAPRTDAAASAVLYRLAPKTSPPA